MSPIDTDSREASRAANAVLHHHEAAAQHELASKHHLEAVRSLEAGDHKAAAHLSRVAREHAVKASEHGVQADKKSKTAHSHHESPAAGWARAAPGR